MKRNSMLKIMLLVTVAMVCFSGCGSKGKEETAAKETTIVVATEETIKETESETETESVETVAQTTESTFDQVVFDVQAKLQAAEKQASELEIKLSEDTSLTQTDLNMLSNELYMVWDDLLNEMWSVLNDALDEQTMDKLLEEQLEWIDYKEAISKKAGEEFSGGSMASMASSQRAAELTRERVYALAVYLGY